MQTISALYDSAADARLVIGALEDEGVASSDISLIGPATATADQRAMDGAEAGARLGAIAGGTGGVLAGIGAITVPGVGPALAAGWLATTLAGIAAGGLAGGAAGGLIGALTEAGCAGDDAHVFAETVRRGGSVVSVRAEDQHVATVRAILDSRPTVDTLARGTAFRSEGWERFEEARPPLLPPV